MMAIMTAMTALMMMALPSWCRRAINCQQKLLNFSALASLQVVVFHVRNCDSAMFDCCFLLMTVVVVVVLGGINYFSCGFLSCLTINWLYFQFVMCSSWGYCSCYYIAHILSAGIMLVCLLFGRCCSFHCSGPPLHFVFMSKVVPPFFVVASCIVFDIATVLACVMQHSEFARKR